MTPPLKSAATGVAPGKVILLGEHAVVYGRTAIAAAIDRQVRVSVVPQAVSPRVVCGEGSARVEAPFALNLFAPKESEPSPQATRLEQATLRAAAILGIEAHDLRIEIASDLPTAVGLGSSAALSVALVRALAGFSSQVLEASAICAAAFELERLFHGFPSGIDNTVATYGGLVAFTRNQTPRHLDCPQPLPLVIAIGRAPRETQAAVRALRQRREADPQAYEGWFDEIADLVSGAEDALANADWRRLGGLFNRNHTLLQQLAVSTSELDAMVDLAQRNGAHGAKLTGGGGGGAVICVHDGDRTPLLAAFRNAGWQAFATDIHPPDRGDHARPERRDTRPAYARQ